MNNIDFASVISQAQIAFGIALIAFILVLILTTRNKKSDKKR